MRSTRITSHPPVGVILAGGPGTRIGGNKASVALNGEPLLHHTLRALRQVLTDIAIIAKPQTVLPPLEGAMIWVEPDEPVHPLFGVGESLALAGGRPVLVCPLDMPFLSARVLGQLVAAEGAGRPAVMVSARGIARPLVACYSADAAELLSEAAHGQMPLEAVVSALEPKLVEVDDELELFDVNTPDDLLQAAGMLDAQRRSVRA
ncbi:MAG TPA: molybdenum cofactor guanylyltransferase [Solirubrobacteraceae bacterium]|jgi:molybdopterin-guanine dinucleotide biosynthesis protein A|nr:molybdenum cofactor guanylyltransferase [Solirubrobacteraceae bacterium]